MKLKDKIIRDAKTTFEQQKENYYKHVIFKTIIISNMKVVMKEIKTYR